MRQDREFARLEQMIQGDEEGGWEDQRLPRAESGKEGGD